MKCKECGTEMKWESCWHREGGEKIKFSYAYCPNPSCYLCPKCELEESE